MFGKCLTKQKILHVSYSVLTVCCLQNPDVHSVRMFDVVTPIGISNPLVLLDVDVYKENTENLAAGFQRNTHAHTHSGVHTHTHIIVGGQEVAQSGSACHASMRP